MTENAPIPIHYIGEVTESSHLESPLMELSAEALGSNRFFAKLPEARQNTALHSLVLLGTQAEIICEGRWKSFRWGDVWGQLNVDVFTMVERGIVASSEPIMRGSFMTLFQMLQAGVNTYEGLKEVKAQCRMESEEPRFKVSIPLGKIQAITRASRLRNR